MPYPGERKEDLMIAAQLADNVIACTDLKHEDETCRLEKLQKELEVHSNGKRGINLVLPTKINTNEWESNTNNLFAIGDYFGYERIADLLPFCERIHDLPKDGKTVWQLRQKNIQDAFNRLLERVEDL
ncbi:MAG: hypothetical protein U9N81_12650 [Bacillota bacterium]|nr:hypothetical protein [Bacillota bacterium]